MTWLLIAVVFFSKQATVCSSCSQEEHAKGYDTISFFKPKSHNGSMSKLTQFLMLNL